jgi:hypothetical protein
VYLVSGGSPELADGSDIAWDRAVGVELRQFGERTVRWRAADRPAVGVGAMRQDRDQPPMRQPAGGQQLLPEFWIELDGGMEASTPRADVNGAVGIGVRRLA